MIIAISYIAIVTKCIILASVVIITMVMHAIV